MPSKTTRSAPARRGWCWITNMNFLAQGSDKLDRGQDRLHAQTLNEWMKKTEIVAGKRPDVPTVHGREVEALGRENLELRPANEILRKASAYFARAELDRRDRGDA
ncbi:MAG: hypothetical protein E5X88_31705 [Mesorhizobium sp.]|nr:MAG: hypothetical protein EOQ76_08050 [Mesorhizobium sp.]RWH34250.1 MAG: hypothetical protein EOQ79_26060 [Mesorhizobium sp.]TIM70356.1 MAG: hypothetical protein E5Y52_02585 [Mesorhizobium sp.]TIO04478.1 MAG: hypothetical protein E5X88_31705 [Mesorhizobium sp.]TIR61874.1 MAG: hypothetical protein E5X22_02765 [Mesorhizobium sp.]